MRAPFVSASGSVRACELLLIELEAPDGHVGFGEAVALGLTAAELRAALEDCRSVLAQDLSHQESLTACAHLAVVPQALAAIDLALWDLAGRRAGAPVWQLLGAADGAPVELNATIASPERSAAAAAAAAARESGFGTVKVKVGLGDDAGRLAAVRAAGGAQLAIRLDANGTWSVEEALASLRALAPVGIELCEEPVHGLEQIRELCAQVSVVVALDETAARPGALEQRVCDAVCLKVARCGGISGLIGAARQARAAGYQVYLASTLDGPLGIAGALHAAAAIEPDRPCGLATLDLFAGRENPLPVSGGRLAPPAGPGLGPDLLSWYDGER